MTGDRDGSAETGCSISLGSFPVSLYAAAEPQWQSLLREYLLRSFGGLAQAYGADEVWRAGAALELLTLAVLRDHPEAMSDPTCERGDIEVVSPNVGVGDFAMLQGVLEDANRLSREGELLVLPSLPEVVALRNWFCDQAVAQAAGVAASPWQLRGDGPEPQRGAVTWDRAIEPGPDICWLIGDDHNTIVAASPPALALLGWSEGLVGQRLLVVIPPAFREAHLAAFTRSVLGGDDRSLGRPVNLPALKADGSQIQMTLTLTRHPAKAGRTVYLGVIEPETGPA